MLIVYTIWVNSQYYICKKCKLFSKSYKKPCKRKKKKPAGLIVWGFEVVGLVGLEPPLYSPAVDYKPVKI
jgi:hypothetical protein